MEESLSLAELTRSCEVAEAALRRQMPDQKFEVSVEAELAALPPDTIKHALHRRVLLGHLYRVRSRKLERRTNPEEAQEAARQLLRREPVLVELSSGDTIEITGRSISALIEISVIAKRISLIEMDRTHSALLLKELSERRKGVSWRASRRLRRRMKVIGRIQDRLYQELELHRRQLYAHLFTPHGGPAGKGEDAPRIWRKFTEADDAEFLRAVFEAGPMRYSKLGDPPRRKEKKPTGEHFGWESALVAWGVRTKVQPAQLYDRDLGQVAAEMRLSAPPSLDEEIDE